MKIGVNQREIQSKYRKTMREKKEKSDKNGIIFVVILMLMFICNLLFKGF